MHPIPEYVIGGVVNIARGGLRYIRIGFNERIGTVGLVARPRAVDQIPVEMPEPPGATSGRIIAETALCIAPDPALGCGKRPRAAINRMDSTRRGTHRWLFAGRAPPTTLGRHFRARKHNLNR